MTQTPGDTIIINSISETTQVTNVTISVGGVPSTQNLPLLNVQDPNLFTAQLLAFALQDRADEAVLTAAVQAADAGKLAIVSPGVTALVGQTIPLDPVTPPAAPTA